MTLIPVAQMGGWGHGRPLDVGHAVSDSQDPNLSEVSPKLWLCFVFKHFRRQRGSSPPTSVEVR